MSTTRARIHTAPTTALASDLVAITGEARVRPHEEHGHVLVVKATANQDVRAVFEAAKKHDVPILPMAPGLETTRFEPPGNGGILLDLSLMNRILEINHSRRYAVVEPGVSWADLEARLLDEGGDLALPLSSAPRVIGPWASCLFDGDGQGLAIGNVDDLVLGVEAVLPNGSIVRTGSRATGDAWWGRGPLPDLLPLFAGWRGSTGLATRLSLSLRYRRRHLRRLLLPASACRAAIAASIRLARTRLFEEAHVIPWTLPHLLLGGSRIRKRHPNEPLAWLAVDFSGDSLPELEYKRVRLAQALYQASRRGGSFEDPLALGDLLRVAPSLDPIEDLPIALHLPGLGKENQRAKLEILAFHGPASMLVDGASTVENLFARRDLVPIVLVRPIPGGYHGIIHVAWLSPEENENSVELRDTAHDASRQLAEMGFIPHRYAARFADEIGLEVERATRDVAGKLRTAFDPGGLLDPIKWGIPRPL